MSMKPSAYLDDLASKYQAASAAHAAESADIKNRDAVLKSQRDAAIKERSRKVSVRAAFAQEGLSSAKELDDQIAALDRQLEAFDLQASEIQGALARCSAAKPARPPVDHLRNVFDRTQCTAIEETSGIAHCFEAMKLLSVESDATGRACSCSFALTSTCTFRLSIKPRDGHFCKGFRPKELDWIPTGDTATIAAAPPPAIPVFRAFVDSSTGTLYLSDTFIEPSDLPGFMIDIVQRIRERIGQGPAELDLGRSYTDDPLMAWCKSAVAAQTHRTPMFPVSKEFAKSPEIYKKIKSHWDAFVDAPWSEAVTGDLARLKYQLESAERPRFWNGGFEGQYGFRVRTRDHDWIVGQVFIVPTHVPIAVGTAGALTVVKGYSSHGQRAVVGRLWLTANHEKS